MKILNESREFGAGLVPASGFLKEVFDLLLQAPEALFAQLLEDDALLEEIIQEAAALRAMEQIDRAKRLSAIE